MSRRITNECLFATARQMKESIAKCRVNGEFVIDDFEANVESNQVSIRYLIPASLGITTVSKLELLNSDNVVLITHNVNESTNGEDYGIVQEFFVNEHGYEFKPFAEDLAEKRYRARVIGDLWWTIDAWDYESDTYIQGTNCKHYPYSEAVSQCPEGWRVPTKNDWENLFSTATLPTELLNVNGFAATYSGYFNGSTPVEYDVGVGFHAWQAGGERSSFFEDGFSAGGGASPTTKMPIRYCRDKF